MKLHLLENRFAGGYTTFGSVWKKGEVWADTPFVLKNEAGKCIPVQSRITAYWPDGSVKWAAHTADSSQMGKNVEILPETANFSLAAESYMEEAEDAYILHCRRVTVTIPKAGDQVLRDLYIDGQKKADSASLVLLLERHIQAKEGFMRLEVPGTGRVSHVEVEEKGPLAWEFRLEGTHVLQTAAEGEDAAEGKLPFILRIRIYDNSSQIDMTHTFLYDGDPKQDYLKGIGLRLLCPMEGAGYNRHIKFGTDRGCFHEASSLLLSWRPRVPEAIYQKQIDGHAVAESQEEIDKLVEASLRAIGETERKMVLQSGPTTIASINEAASKMPSWSRYQLYQDSDSHFCIRKKVAAEECCFIDSLHGNHSQGTMAVGGTGGGLMVGIRDFWQKYPGGLEAEGLDQEQTAVTCWLRSPVAEAYDFRHYATAGYDQTYYEGFPEVGADPVGIANTNSLSLMGFDEVAPSDDALTDFGKRINKPAVYVGEPAYYHELKAFGYWSLPKRETAMECWLEDQLDKAVAFYEQEVEQRKWYGMFNYGDVMHTYDRFRHVWKYDMGGYAWQNTELVPTLWLWLAFIRSGREDIFSLAEAMCRHCSEVDLYHLGKYKGIGSRHNVRHWGCSCKEARIAMAGHHRYYYYLTGDRRLGDVFEDVKDGDQAILNMDPLRYFYRKDEMVCPTHARSGPDWSSFVSNWMTRWERFNDKAYEQKIRTGVEDIKKAPLKLVSGPDFEYDPASGHLRYIGERAAGGTHLQICMGAAEVWLELSLLLEDEEWKDMLARYGRFYYLEREKQLEESGGIIGKREFTYPFMASGIAAYGAWYLQDKKLARKTWQILLRSMITEEDVQGFVGHRLENAGSSQGLYEIPWITTNFVSQWCLNLIMALDFIREELPVDMEGAQELLQDVPVDGLYHKA